MEGDKAVDLLAHDVDPYEDAMHDDPDVGFHAFLPSKPQSFDPNIPHDEVCIYSTCLFNFKLVFYLLVNKFCLPQLSVSVVFLIWVVSMTGIVSSARCGNLDVAAASSLRVLVSGVHSLRSIENMYPEQIQSL
jgi:hypothetical protein